MYRNYRCQILVELSRMQLSLLNDNAELLIDIDVAE